MSYSDRTSSLLLLLLLTVVASTTCVRVDPLRVIRAVQKEAAADGNAQIDQLRRHLQGKAKILSIYFW